MSIMPFGMHKDKEIETIPSRYLKFLLESDWFEEKYLYLVNEIEEELAFRDTWHKHF